MVKQLLDAYEKFCTVITVVCLAVMVAINMVQIFFRFFFNQSFIWVHPLTMLLFMWMTFLGAFIIYYRKKDIVVRFFIDKLSAFLQEVLHFMTSALTIFLLLIIIWQGDVLIKQQSSIMQIIPLPRYVQAIPLLMGLSGILFDNLADIVAMIKGFMSFGPERKK